MILRIILPVAAGLIACEMIAWPVAGTRDQTPFLFWTVPYLCVVSAMSFALNYSLKSQREAVRVFAEISLGLTVGVAWSLLWWGLLGAWAPLLSVPSGLCWTAGGVTVAVCHCLPRLSVFRFTSYALAIGLVFGALGLVVPPVTYRLGGHRTVQTVFVEYTPGENPLELQVRGEVKRGDKLSPTELASIRQHFATGKVAVTGATTAGRGEAIRLVVVMQRPLTQPVTIPLPDHGSLLCLQTDDGWRTVPDRYTQLRRTLQLTDLPALTLIGPRHTTRYHLEIADGDYTGTAFLHR